MTSVNTLNSEYSQTMIDKHKEKHHSKRVILKCGHCTFISTKPDSPNSTRHYRQF